MEGQKIAIIGRRKYDNKQRTGFGSPEGHGHAGKGGNTME